MDSDWVKVVERRGQSVLISSYFYNGIQAKYFRKSTGLPVGLDHYLIKDYCNYYRQSEVSRFQRKMVPFYRKTQWGVVQTTLQKLNRQGVQLLAYARKINHEPNLSRHALRHFKRFSDLCLQFGPAMYFPILIEPQVEAEAKRIIAFRVPKQQEEAYAQLTATIKPTEGTKELVHLHKIAERYHANSEDSAIQNLCSAHVRKYGWLSFTKFVGEPWTAETVLQRIRNMNSAAVAAERALLEKRYRTQKTLAAGIMRRWRFSPAEKRFFRTTQELAFFRTDRIDTYTKAGYLAKKLFRAVAEQLGLSDQELMFATYAEILTSLEKKKAFPRAVILQRMNHPWQLSFTKGKMAFRYLPDEKTETAKDQSATVIRGQIASRGFARGEVRVIRGVLEFDKMCDGAILVTSMTTPDFVPLMQRAAAIVTDEGGITCHAAIVSRELKKPCVIGTKIATTSFKDGDLVEVDAENGIVRKLP